MSLLPCAVRDCARVSLTTRGRCACGPAWPASAVLFAPLTCVEMRGARTERAAIVVDFALTINLTAPIIEKVVSRLKVAHLDLLRLLQLDFAACKVPAAALARSPVAPAPAAVADPGALATLIQNGDDFSQAGLSQHGSGRGCMRKGEGRGR